MERESRTTSKSACELTEFNAENKSDVASTG